VILSVGLPIGGECSSGMESGYAGGGELQTPGRRFERPAKASTHLLFPSLRNAHGRSCVRQESQANIESLNRGRNWGEKHVRPNL
jgi:hypothetical protein